MMGLLSGLVFALIVPLLSACASTSSVDSYVNPAFNRSMFKSVAVMPLTNQLRHRDAEAPDADAKPCMPPDTENARC